jgi:hypothetical protein
MNEKLYIYWAKIVLSDYSIKFLYYGYILIKYNWMI